MLLEGSLQFKKEIESVRMKLTVPEQEFSIGKPIAKALVSAVHLMVLSIQLILHCAFPERDEIMNNKRNK